MEWIKVEDGLPNEDEECWIYTILFKDVISGIFSEKCPDYENYSKIGNIKMNSELPRKPGFCINQETGDYIFLDKTTHWMPYYTPEPPVTQQP